MTDSERDALDVASRHLTAVDGNVFEDLGFSPEEAAALLEDADCRIAEAKAPSGEGAE